MRIKVVAEFTTWFGEKVKTEIKRAWIHSIVDAVVGQYMFVDNKSGFTVVGYDFCFVNIYEVKDEN